MKNTKIVKEMFDRIIKYLPNFSKYVIFGKIPYTTNNQYQTTSYTKTILRTMLSWLSWLKPFRLLSVALVQAHLQDIRTNSGTKGLKCDRLV